MSGANTALFGAGGVALAAVAGGPLTEIFNDLALALAVMGAAGGITRGLANRLPWSEAWRGCILGALLAFGLGAKSPQIVGELLGLQIEGGTLPWLFVAAYLIGLVQDKVFSVLLSAKGKGK